MSYHSNRVSSNVGAGIAGILIMLFLLLLFLSACCLRLVIQTFRKYPHNKWLWIALAGCLVSSALSLVLYVLLASQYVSILAAAGVMWLLTTCKVVEINASQTLIRQPSSMVQEVLHTSWWSTDDNAEAA